MWKRIFLVFLWHGEKADREARCRVGRGSCTSGGDTGGRHRCRSWGAGRQGRGRWQRRGAMPAPRLPVVWGDGVALHGSPNALSVNPFQPTTFPRARPRPRRRLAATCSASRSTARTTWARRRAGLRYRRGGPCTRTSPTDLGLLWLPWLEQKKLFFFLFLISKGRYC